MANGNFVSSPLHGGGSWLGRGREDNEEFLGTPVLLSVSSEGGDSAESLPKLTT